MIEDDIPGSSQTKTVKIDKGPSDTKSIADDEVPGTWGIRRKQRGQFASQKHSKKINLLKNKLEITAQFRKQHRLFNRLEFRYYYKDAKKLVEDFRAYREYKNTNLI